MRTFVVIGLLAATVSVVAFLAAPLYGDVLSGAGTAVPLAGVTATCDSAGDRCAAAITRLNP